jgi:hypothetical protein
MESPSGHHPGAWVQPDNTIGSTVSLFDGLVGGLGYQTFDSSRFFIVFKLAKNNLSVNVEVLDREESAEEIFYSFNRLHNGSLPKQRIWKNEPDRLTRTLPTGKLFVTIRKQMAKGRRIFVVHLSFRSNQDKPADS